jgi:ubiquitin-conjugating enzyme E2 L3
MSSSRRLQKELAEIKAADLPYFTNIQVDESNILVWRGLLVPNSPPYNKGAFILEINFPPEYPFKPPQVNIERS